MIPDNVTLVVKAPNQQIEDQNIECLSSWTVLQLKGHLSEVYPSKPSTDEQKIIYSGQLLDDSAILKDVLRTYESQLVYTMHLVCSPKREMAQTPTTQTPNTDGIRHRNVNVNTEERPAENRPETRQNDQNHSVEMQNYLSSFVNNYGRVPPYPNYNMGAAYLPVPNDPNGFANHMMMMQQAYLRYMQQYANMWQAPNPAVPATLPTTPEATAAPEVPPPAPIDDEENAARDWLDHLYAASRLAILFSLVYLYGSPARLLLVVVLCAAAYLHQIGFFRDLQVNVQAGIAARNNGNANNVNNAAGNVNNVAGNVNNVAGNVNAGGNNVNAEGNIGGANNANGDGNNAREVPVNPVNNDNEQQTLLSVTWMIFTSFFASLIPDTN